MFFFIICFFVLSAMAGHWHLQFEIFECIQCCRGKISQDGSCACSMSCFVALLSYGLTFFVSTAPVDQCDIIGYAVFFVVTGESQT